MKTFLIIGLPKPIKARLEARAKKDGYLISSILSDKGKKGTPMLLPHPSQAAHRLCDYFDKAAEPSIVVLPYTKIPHDVYEELHAIEGLDGEVHFIEESDEDWPHLETRSFNQKFLDSLFSSLEKFLFPRKEPLPSTRLLEIEQSNDSFIIAKGAIESCDEVAKHRFKFIIDASEALLDICNRSGNVGPIEKYFESLGLDHAQSGGIEITLRASLKDGTVIHEKTSQTHLKQGDKTTPQAAARVYYQTFKNEDRYYVVVLYAGPHPENNCNCTITLEEDR